MERMTEPKISVILPCYNAHAFMAKTLDSLREQTWGNLETIIINDGSTELETLDFLSGIQDEFRVIHQENKGLPAARNRGFAEASGEYILPLDCDDWLEPTAVEELFAALRTGGSKSFAYPQMILEGELSGETKKDFNFFEQLFLNQLPYCLLVSKSAWAEVGGYRESMRFGYEDWDYNIRLGAAGYIGVTASDPLLHYRVTNHGMLLSKSGKMHCFLWEDIRRNSPHLYGYKELRRHWTHWAGKPSTYPLSIYWAWLAVCLLSPNNITNYLVKKMRYFSASRRISRRHNS